MSETRAAYFNAGLGDVFRTIYETQSYKYLSETTSPVPVVVASHNPFTLEIFRHHRNASNFILYDLGHKYQEFFAKGLRSVELNKAVCEFAGVVHASIVRGSAGDYMPVFDAPDTLSSSGHVVFQPFAGASRRSLPPEVIDRTLKALHRLPCQVYLVTRSYLRQDVHNNIIHGLEDGRLYEGGNVTLLDNLSVPATVNLIKTCRAYVGSWSSLQQVAWFENKPVAVFYPTNHHDVVQRTGYAFGLDRPNTLARDFPSVNADELEQFISRWSPDQDSVAASPDVLQPATSPP